MESNSDAFPILPIAIGGGVLLVCIGALGLVYALVARRKNDRSSSTKGANPVEHRDGESDRSHSQTLSHLSNHYDVAPDISERNSSQYAAFQNPSGHDEYSLGDLEMENVGDVPMRESEYGNLQLKENERYVEF